MSYAEEHYADDLFAIDAALDERVAFIRRTYLHVFGAILAFIGLETLYFSVDAIWMPLTQMIGGNWWMALIAFMLVAWVADKWAQSGATPGVQYAGLALYTVAISVIFVPLLAMAQSVGNNVIVVAAFLTMLIFGGLTTVVLVTRQDFSFLRNVLWMGSLAALGFIVASAFMGFSLGMMFSAAMVVLMSGWILYDTSNILHHYRTDQHVAAALALFASVATLFWYVLRLVMASRD